MTTLHGTASGVQDVRGIAHLEPTEYARIANAELDAFLRLLSRLEPDDWQKPTACTLWDVRDVVAHQAGHVQMGSGLRGFLAQSNPRATGPYRKRGMSILDALNQAQVDMRRSRPVDEVVTELREGTRRSIASRLGLSWVAGQVRVPVSPVGLMPLRDLLFRIFPRDMWIHRLDIADATGKPFEQTAKHDGVMVAEAVADISRHLRKKAPDIGLTLRLIGPAGGAWLIGTGTDEHLTLEMDVTDFMRRTSERVTADGALDRVTSVAPRDRVRQALDVLLAPY
jgi:uncharacterized protein (TIGR03083 family)